jgi:hypothetical protein
MEGEAIAAIASRPALLIDHFAKEVDPVQPLVGLSAARGDWHDFR